MRIKQKLVLDENKLMSEKKSKVKDLHFVEMCIRAFHGNFLSEKQYIFFIFIQISYLSKSICICIIKNNIKKKI